MENSGASISMAYSIRRESWVFLGHGLPLLKMSNIMQNHAVHGLGAKNGCLILINLNTWKTIQNYCSSHEQIFDPHNTTLAWHRYWHGTWSTSLVAFHQSTWTNIPERTHPIPSTILFVPPIESWIILWSSLIYAWIGVPCWGYSTGPKVLLTWPPTSGPKTPRGCLLATLRWQCFAVQKKKQPCADGSGSHWERK